MQTEAVSYSNHGEKRDFGCESGADAAERTIRAINRRVDRYGRGYEESAKVYASKCNSFAERGLSRVVSPI